MKRARGKRTAMSPVDGSVNVQLFPFQKQALKELYDLSDEPEQFIELPQFMDGPPIVTLADAEHLHKQIVAQCAIPEAYLKPVPQVNYLLQSEIAFDMALEFRRTIHADRKDFPSFFALLQART